MRNFFFITLALLTFSSSQAQDKVRYTQQAPEIEAIKTWFKAYNEGDWAKLESFYAKDATITHNTGEASPNQLIQGLKSTLTAFSDYKFTSVGEEERVVTDKGETWVNAWADWKGTMKGTGEEVNISIHGSFQFKDGKIVEEHAYYDVSGVNAAMQNLNKSIVQRLYDGFATGDMPTVLGLMDEKIAWNEAEGNKYADGNPYIGPDAVLNGVFARIGAEHEYFKVTDIELHTMDNNKVLATLRYDAKWKEGKAYNAQAAHLWTLSNGKIAAFQQFTNTKLLAETEK